MNFEPVNAYEYKWSGCQYYTVKSKAPGWLERDFILSYFGKKPTTARRSYQEFVRSVMDQEYENPLSELSHSVILDSRGIVEIKSRFL